MGRSTYVWHGAASLRRRLVLEEPTFTPDGAGGVEASYKQKASLWACIVSENGPGWTHRTQMDRKESVGCYRITLRWRRGITTAHRFRDGDQVFKILGTEDPDGHRHRLVCMAEAYMP